MEELILSHKVEYDSESISQYAISDRDHVFHFWNYSPTKRPFKKSQGFCISKRCDFGEKSFKVANHFRKPKMFFSKDHSVHECPKCKSSLFWSNQWEEL